MAAPINPGKKRSFGNDSWGWCPTIASLSVPTITELNAAGAINLSCYLLRDQADLTASVDQVTLDSALCEIQDFQVNGAETISMPELRVLFDPQGASGSNGQKAWAGLTDLASGFLWRRQGKRSTTDLVVADKVDIIPGDLGIKVPTKTNNDPSGVYAFTVGFSVTAAPVFQVAVAA